MMAKILKANQVVLHLTLCALTLTEMESHRYIELKWKFDENIVLKLGQQSNLNDLFWLRS